MTTEAAKSHILVVDDEVQVRRLLVSTLEDAGYECTTAATGKDALVSAAGQPPGAIVLDLGLPDMSGIEVLQQLRDWCKAPVLVLSVFGEETTKVTALDAGADDYLTKPFGEQELLARLRALLRRLPSGDDSSVIVFGPVEIDLGRRLVSKSGAPIKLTAKEYSLLRLFVAHRGKVLTHRQILSELWGPRSESQTHYLHVYMTRLRQKLEDDPDQPRYFQTEAGIGYRFVDHAE